MVQQLIGTGGWAYFKVPQKSSLKAYSEIFNFVEVNYTFYEYPDFRTVTRWRRAVPKSFTFSVRCHQDLTHRIGLKPVDEAYAVIGKMKACCGILEAPFLVLETPESYVFDSATIRDAHDFLASINLKEIRLVWEVRSSITPDAIRLMEELNIVHCVDLSKTLPRVNSDVVYTRLFGKGSQNIYQFTDDELVEIEERAVKSGPRTVAFAYHGLRMNTDAARFLSYVKTGTFPMVTAPTGIESAREALSEDAIFPTSKGELIEDQGWKVIDLTSKTRVHFSDVLDQIPDCTYESIDEVVDAMEEFL